MESSKTCYFTPVMRLCQLAGMENFDLSKIGLVEDGQFAMERVM